MPNARSTLALAIGLAAAVAACGNDPHRQARTSTPTASLTASPTATATATPIDDELAPAEDNGSEGLNPFDNPAHVRPADACADSFVSTSGSLVIRVLPKGPRADDGSLAFTAGACVYLPPGYLDSGLRYPVLYLLHGGGGDQADWVTFGGVRTIMDDSATEAANAAIVVMPDGRDAQWYDSVDGTIRNEQYVLDFLIPYIDRHLRTIATRAGRAIDGLSNGGFGAMHLAAKAPDRFIAAGGMSSNLAGVSFTGLGDRDTARYHGSRPADLAANLGGLDLTLDIGTVCLTDRARDNCLTWRFEQLFVPGNRTFVASLDAVRDGDDGIYEYRETEGGHSWNWWPLWLRERHLPFLLARLADPQPDTAPVEPTTPRPGFDYRSVAAQFSVWGYDVTVTRDVAEFLDLRDVRAEGLTAQGSGQATVLTAGLYEPGKSYSVSGAGDAEANVVADAGGRLLLSIDLGPSHQYEQFTPEASALEAAGNYWRERQVTITAGSG